MGTRRRTPTDFACARCRTGVASHGAGLRPSCHPGQYYVSLLGARLPTRFPDGLAVAYGGNDPAIHHVNHAGPSGQAKPRAILHAAAAKDTQRSTAPHTTTRTRDDVTLRPQQSGPAWPWPRAPRPLIYNLLAISLSARPGERNQKGENKPTTAGQQPQQCLGPMNSAAHRSGLLASIINAKEVLLISHQPRPLGRAGGSATRRQGPLLHRRVPGATWTGLGSSSPPRILTSESIGDPLR